MKWEKIGKIFDPQEHALAEECSIFSKSPQALIFDDFVRIYFCSQKKTPNGKYVSCPQYVDFNKKFDKILQLSKGPIVELGKLGEFDEHGIFPINVLRYENQVFAYTSGWSRRISVSIDMAIGLAISEDNGLSFKKYGTGGPIMAAAINEPFLVGDPFVKHLNGKFHMWYIFGTNWDQPSPDDQAERFYKIAHAESADGINWLRDSKAIVGNKLLNECQALPTVFYLGERYHMYFCYRNAFNFRNNPNNSYRLGYAFSDDLLEWTRDDSQSGIDVAESGWDSEMICYPNVFECDGQIYLLYNGNEFGKFGFGLAKLVDY
jgi:sucrose-6-phosphate hydrolase SacC (GH32 family)